MTNGKMSGPATDFTDLLREDIWHASRDQDEIQYPNSSALKLHYDRARSIVKRYGLTVSDISNLTAKFWDFHSQLFVSRDSSAFTILTIHWNLCMGTIARFAKTRPDLYSLLAELESFDVCGEFMLTELDHGLDARHIQTTATLLEDGSFDLHTPNLGAAKVMPPTTPQIGMPRVAVVFAQLVVSGEAFGIRPFIVRINETDRMCAGVTSRVLPGRPGARSLDHTVTTFHHVRLGQTALLGSLQPSCDKRGDFMKQIWRVSVGTLSLSMSNIPSLKLCLYVAGKYSLRRMVTGPGEDCLVPIINFSTQYRPILNGLAGLAVYEAYAKSTVKGFMDASLDTRVRAGLACSFKASIIRETQETLAELSERLGWQGLMGYNEISEVALAQRGNSIAEGDVLVLCIRLVSEILQGKYSLPSPRYAECMLAQYENGLLEELEAKVAAISIQKRGREFDTCILPHCRKFVEAAGQRMAFEAALASGINTNLLSLFEINCISREPSWYIEHKGWTRAQIHEVADSATLDILPELEQLLEDTGAEPWVIAPILSQDRWNAFVSQLPTFTGVDP